MTDLKYYRLSTKLVKAATGDELKMVLLIMGQIYFHNQDVKITVNQFCESLNFANQKVQKLIKSIVAKGFVIKSENGFNWQGATYRIEPQYLIHAVLE